MLLSNIPGISFTVVFLVQTYWNHVHFVLMETEVLMHSRWATKNLTAWT